MQNPFDFLRKWFPYPISLLAALGDHNGVLSGSASAAYFLPKQTCFTKDSDFDFYVPSTNMAFYYMILVLKISGVEWQNTLLRQLRQLAENKATFVPRSLIQCISDHVFKKRLCSKSELEEYLRASLRPKEGFETEFVKQFCRSCHDYPNNNWRQDIEERGRVWIFTDTWAGFYPREPYEIEHISKVIQAIDGEDQTIFSEARKEIEGLMPWMEDRGRKKELIVQFLTYRVKIAKPWISKAKIVEQLHKLLDIDTEPVPSKEPSYPWYPLFQGSLKERKIQLILLRQREPKQTAVRAILDFYATHIMSFMSGTVGGHLYYSTAVKGKSWELDFTQDPKQRNESAQMGIAKWRRRGWEFYGREEVIKRTARDRESKIVEFQDFYEQALGELPVKYETPHRSRSAMTKRHHKKDPDYPWDYFKNKTAQRKKNYTTSEWGEIMGRQRKELETYSWVEENRRIRQVDNDLKKPTITYGHRIFDWVHEELEQHKYVIGREMWTDKVKKEAWLDVLFSGLLRHITAVEPPVL